MVRHFGQNLLQLWKTWKPTLCSAEASVGYDITISIEIHFTTLYMADLIELIGTRAQPLGELATKASAEKRAREAYIFENTHEILW
jgi:hypothetical protein